MDFQQLISQLDIALQQPLPGHERFLSQMPEHARLRRSGKPNDRTRQSAVLLALYPCKNEAFFPLILRPKYDGTHGGQVAFPGGQMELHDENLKRTALRETEEEVGIKAIDVTVLGALSKIFIPPSNFWVTPYVGYMMYRPDFFPDPKEVDLVIEVPLKTLFTTDALREKDIEVRGTKMTVSGFSLNEQWVWGATALMLGEFIEIYESL